ncbi:hypothetical protein [Hydrogenophaga crassostreae]|nr:hypothetical protein [Hydrogenophaga crassostreae]
MAFRFTAGFGLLLVLLVGGCASGQVSSAEPSRLVQGEADHPYCLHMLQSELNGDRMVQAVRLGRNGCADSNAAAETKVERDGVKATVVISGYLHQYTLASSDACGNRYYEVVNRSLENTFVGRSVLVVREERGWRTLSSRNPKREPAWSDEVALSLVAELPYVPAEGLPSPLAMARRVICP